MNIVTHRLLVSAAIVEMVTGLTLMVAPMLFVQYLLKEEVVGAGLAVSRVAGFALVALGVGCWPRLPFNRDDNFRPMSPLLGMLTYNGLITIYLVGMGATNQSVGLLLWPGVVLHGAFALLFVREVFYRRC
ncbi:hypothetical protein [Anatilimnocola floriformis]|uniref:hypothetical protein n=1 Tax=Anatilimnocola floriformis TaxID=2948575 RepID=UPI0020C1BB97|nr:hypothetical protein [Anatilimnocola floriformis]